MRRVTNLDVVLNRRPQQYRSMLSERLFSRCAQPRQPGSRLGYLATSSGAVGLFAVVILAVTGPGEAATRSRAETECPVTVPNGKGPPPANHGNNALAVGLAPTGTYDALMFYEANQGKISIKFPWMRLVKGQLRITARRLDAPAPPATARVPNGYGDEGFQASGVVFPTVGCWRVTGSVSDATLSFVIKLIGVIPVAHVAGVSAVVHGRTATVSWSANAVSERYDIAVRRPGAPWRIVVWRTTDTTYSLQRSVGRRVDVRVRGMDKWLNAGPWSRPVRVVLG